MFNFVLIVTMKYCMSETKKIYGLIGKKLGHSFSRDFFNRKFSSENINAEYLNFEINSIDSLLDIIKSTPNLSGLNVTIPYKEEVLPLLTRIDSIADAIGAVNTIKILRTDSGVELYGYNTDIIGFCESLKPMLSPANSAALILGTGGAAKAMRAGLQSLGIDVKMVSRQSGIADFTYLDLTDEIIKQHTVIVNSTPLGMWPNVETAPDIPYSAIGNCHVVFDAVYNPNPTRFLDLCQQKGAIIKSGLEMLIRQANAAWEIWNNS